MNKKLSFRIRMYDKDDNQCPALIEAHSADQALTLVQGMPGNERFVAFGLVGEDGNCHKWKYRAGVPRRRPGGLGTFASTLQHARAVPPPAPRKAVEPPSGPVVISLAEMYEVVKKRALPQMSPAETFQVKDITKYIPEPYRANWLPTVWPAVMKRLINEGVLLKPGHFNYLRNPEWINRKLVEEEPAVAAAVAPNGHMNGHTNGHDVAPIAQPEAAPPPIMVRSEPEPEPTLTPDDKIDATLLLLRRLVVDDRAKKEKIRALGDRLLDVLGMLDTIRDDLDTLMKAEEAVPLKVDALLTSVRPPPPPPQAALAA